MIGQGPAGGCPGHSPLPTAPASWQKQKMSCPEPEASGKPLLPWLCHLWHTPILTCCWTKASGHVEAVNRTCDYLHDSQNVALSSATGTERLAGTDRSAQKGNNSTQKGRRRKLFSIINLTPGVCAAKHSSKYRFNDHARLFSPTDLHHALPWRQCVVTSLVWVGRSSQQR